ncbi:hypothetical protein VA599_16735 [Chromobacterium sp. TRC.1.1.SA]|uniref:Uncharacterized protein n=1 Tax=Chromobacterium indicum TaxID=3110228 RepID=A0ABV0CMS4_9NEIS
MQKYMPKHPVSSIHPLLIAAAYLLYHALYSGRFGRFGRICLALVMVMSLVGQLPQPPFPTRMMNKE